MNELYRVDAVGLVLPVDHDIWKVIFPPNGYGCKCSVSALTARQAEEEGIGGEPDVEMVEFTNPRTGKTVLIPDDITPSFAHNHGDRLGAMDALFGDKHGEDALAEMIAQRETWLDRRYSMPSDAVKVLALPDKVSGKEVRRLTKEQSANNTKAVVAFVAVARVAGRALVVAQVGQCLFVCLYPLPLSRRKGGAHVGVEDGFQAARTAEPYQFRLAVQRVGHDLFAPPAFGH